MRRLLIVFVLMATMLGIAPQTTQAETQAGKPLWFKETRHTLAYNFRLFWERNGSLPIFGYPITEVFLEDGRPVQYFERARFEWHADIGWTLAGHLGRWAAEQVDDHPAFNPVSGAAYAGQIYFPETKHTLGGLFRQYWERKGGLQTFGYPLSEEFLEQNRDDGKTYTVQYFERARFEYHPELPAKYQVSLGLLGKQYLAAKNNAPAWATNGVNNADVAWDAVRPTRIRMPRIGIDTNIVEAGFSLGEWDVPRYTAAHYWPIAGFPNTQGNIVIGGHVGYRDIIFNYLPSARVGDKLMLTVNGVERSYTINEVLTVLPEDTWVMDATSQETVTLITCVPIGVYSHRLIVRAKPDN